MENLSERVAYLKGLAEGMKIDQATNEGKLLISIIDVLGEVSESINEIEEAHLQLNEQVEDIDEDLAQLEYEVYDEDDEDDEDEDDDGIEYFEVECPNCKEKVFMDEDMLDSEEEIVCPNCKETIEIEFDCDCDCGCDCGCEDE